MSPTTAGHLHWGPGVGTLGALSTTMPQTMLGLGLDVAFPICQSPQGCPPRVWLCGSRHMGPCRPTSPAPAQALVATRKSRPCQIATRLLKLSQFALPSSRTSNKQSQTAETLSERGHMAPIHQPLQSEPRWSLPSPEEPPVCLTDVTAGTGVPRVGPCPGMPPEPPVPGALQWSRRYASGDRQGHKTVQLGPVGHCEAR